MFISSFQITVNEIKASHSVCGLKTHLIHSIDSNGSWWEHMDILVRLYHSCYKQNKNSCCKVRMSSVILKFYTFHDTPRTHGHRAQRRLHRVGMTLRWVSSNKREENPI